MGASESRLSDEAPKGGYHVLRVASGSPAFHAGIEPFFDYCVGIDGVPLHAPAKETDAGLGAWKSLEDREGQLVTLNVWSAKHQAIRSVPLTPSRLWSTSTATPPGGQPSLLGLSMRYCDPTQALSHVWHVLDILESSPAESAGLVPWGDFILGWTGGPLRGEGDFYELVEAHADKSLRLYVYNADYDHTREVAIVPNRNWGGNGLLGCGVGYGLLHRIPKPADTQKNRTGSLPLAAAATNNYAAASPASPASAVTVPQAAPGYATQQGPYTPGQGAYGQAGHLPVGRSHDIRHSIAEEDEPDEHEGRHVYGQPTQHPDHSLGVTVSVHPDEGSDDEIL